MTYEGTMPPAGRQAKSVGMEAALAASRDSLGFDYPLSRFGANFDFISGRLVSTVGAQRPLGGPGSCAPRRPWPIWPAH